MRVRATTIGAASAALLVSGLAVAPVAAEPAAPTRAPAKPPAVYVPDERPLPAWAVAGRQYRSTIGLLLRGLAPRKAKGAPARIQVRYGDRGTWRTVGEARARLTPNRREARATIRFRLRNPGRPTVRAQFRVRGSWIGVRRGVTVTRQGTRFPVRGTQASYWNSWAAIGNSGRHLAWGQDDIYPYAYAGPSFGPFGQTTQFLGTGADVAATAPTIAYAGYQIAGGEDLGDRRIKLHDFASGTTVDAARQLDGTQLTWAAQPSLSSNGRGVAFVTAYDRIVPGVPGDRHPRVYLARPYDGIVRHLGRGLRPDISPSGRYVSWVSPEGRIRMFDSSTGQYSTAYAPTEHRVERPQIAGDGTGLVFTRQIGSNPRQAVRLDLRSGRVTVIGPALEASAGDGGQRIALLRATPGGGKDVYIWREAVPRPVLVTEGPNGTPSGRAISVDVDPLSRYLAVIQRPGPTPMVPGAANGTQVLRYDLGS